MNTKTKNLLINSILPIISAILVAGLAYAAWMEPPSGITPPGANVPAPINTGPDSQSKAGALGIWGLFKTYTTTILATSDTGNPSGNVGIGTNNPNSPAPNGKTAGNLDVNDIFLRSIGQWASAANGGGGACYTDYSLALGWPVGKPCKISGFTNKGSLGRWGNCFSDFVWGAAYYIYRPPGAGCSAGDQGGQQWTPHNDFGEAYLCCQ